MRPRPGNLTWATIRVPTRFGPIDAAFNQTAAQFTLELRVPAFTEAVACVPKRGGASDTVKRDGVAVRARADGEFLCVGGIRGGGALVVV